MYLKRNRRLKDWKEHFYWNIVESKRCGGGKIEAWCRVIEAFDEGSQHSEQLALFSADRAVA